jgi:HSP20 family protein
VLTVKAERQRLEDEVDVIAEERPRGVFSRQLFLGETLATDKIEAAYNGGVLRLRIPVAEEAKPRKVQITSGEGDQPLTAISA